MTILNIRVFKIRYSNQKEKSRNNKEQFTTEIKQQLNCRDCYEKTKCMEKTVILLRLILLTKIVLYIFIIIIRLTIIGELIPQMINYCFLQLNKRYPNHLLKSLKLILYINIEKILYMFKTIKKKNFNQIINYSYCMIQT